MIIVSRLGGSKIVINADHIEMIEETPDTVITLSSGRKVMVREKTDEIIKMYIAHKRKILPIIKDGTNDNTGALPRFD